MKEFQNKIPAVFLQAILFFAANYFLDLVPWFLLLATLIVCLIGYLLTPLLITTAAPRTRTIIIVVLAVIALAGVAVNGLSFDSHAIKDTRERFVIIGKEMNPDAASFAKDSYPDIKPGKKLGEMLIGDFKSTEEIYTDVDHYKNVLFGEFMFWAFFLSLSISAIMDAYRVKKMQ